MKQSIFSKHFFKFLCGFVLIIACALLVAIGVGLYDDAFNNNESLQAEPPQTEPPQ